MNEEFEPRTEAKGALAPPNRRPPTAVGVSTPPPPPPFRRIAVSRPRTVLQPLYIFTASSITVGTALLILAPWLLLKVTGATIGSIGLFFLILIVWVNSGAAAAWSSRRDPRALRR